MTTQESSVGIVQEALNRTNVHQDATGDSIKPLAELRKLSGVMGPGTELGDELCRVYLASLSEIGDDESEQYF